MFIDEVRLTIRAGNGGNGKVAFFPRKKGPCGGNGGSGGDVYVQAKKEITSLHHIANKKSLEAEDGMPGKSYMKTGRDGKDLVIYVPLHTEIENQTNNRTYTISEYEKKYVLCKGGIGGRGNNAFKSATNRTPTFAEKGFLGESFSFVFTLKLIADVGLIGLPNAGKSSLLNMMTNANVKTAPYPFTTLEPHLGAYGKIIIADIPGLIEGASIGKGLGITFLKHIEKVSVLIHCISIESGDLFRDYQTVRNELKAYNKKLIEKPEIVLLTKSDLINKNDFLVTSMDFFRKKGIMVLSYSMYDPKSLNTVKKVITQLVLQKG